jgi:hypothetical protein
VAIGQRALAELDVAPAGVDHPARLAEVRRRHHHQRLLQALLDFGLHGIGQLLALAGEHLDAVVGVWVVRGADDDPGTGVEGARQVGHCRSRHRPEQQTVHAGCRQTGFQR